MNVQEGIAGINIEDRIEASDMEVEGGIIKASGIIVYIIGGLLKEPKYLLLKASNKPFHWTPPKGNA